jgi:hypothetical protein
MKKVLNRMSKLLVMVSLLPLGLLAQNPGDNPDARPQDVPFDGTMSWILIVAGLILSMIILRKSMHKKVAVTK